MSFTTSCTQWVSFSRSVTVPLTTPSVRRSLKLSMRALPSMTCPRRLAVLCVPMSMTAMREGRGLGVIGEGGRRGR